MATDSSNRTLVLSVVAVDLVCYSQKSVAEQLSLKDHFNQVLLRAIRDISVADRIILDTGDGVAMGFLGDPEDALYVAMFMHDAIHREHRHAENASGDTYDIGGENAIRIGINLGPVRLATGVGGHPNIIGDGVNVAERIMGFAEPGQLTASRPYYEVMSRMSDHYATLFKYAGVHTDKQVRSHEVYLVGKSSAAFQHAEQGVTMRAARRASESADKSAPIKAPAPIASSGGAFAQMSETRAMAASATIGKNPESPSQPAPVAQVGSAESKPSPLKEKPLPPAPAPQPVAVSTERHAALIDFLEDRNKVATTATLLAIVAVTLGSLLVYRQWQHVKGDSATPTVAAVSPANDMKPAPGVLPPPVPGGSPPSAPPVTDLVASKPPVSAPKDTQASAAIVTKKAENVPAVKADPKVTPGPPPANLAPVPSKPNAVAAAPVAMPLPAPSGDKPKDAKGDKSDKNVKNDKNEKGVRSEPPDKAVGRDGLRGEPRKPVPPRIGSERERPVPAAATPIVPTFQTPAELPRPATVAPTPPPPPASADISVTVVSRSSPSFPVEGVRQGIKFGFVKARLTIDAAGNVSDISILEARPILAFARETRITLKKWKFNPGAPGRTMDAEITFTP